MRVLITGITGFIGRRLARRLETAGHWVTGLAADGGEPLPGIAAEIHQADILEPDELGRVIRHSEPNAVIHLAALSHVGQSWKRPGDYLRINFSGVRHLLAAAHGRRVIFASTAEVYGKVPDDEQPITEERPLDPRSPYAMTKACAEDLALGEGAIVTRSFNAVGAGQAGHFALPSFAGQLATIARGEAEPVIRVGDLSPRRDFLHAEDAADAFLTLLEKGEGGHTYNLASGEAHSIGELLERLIAISGVAAKIERDEDRVRPVDLPLLLGDASRLRALGWRPARTLDEALGEIWREARHG